MSPSSPSTAESLDDLQVELLDLITTIDVARERANGSEGGALRKLHMQARDLAQRADGITGPPMRVEIQVERIQRLVDRLYEEVARHGGSR